MKRLVLLLICLWFSGVAMAQKKVVNENEVPEPIRKTFLAKYATSKTRIWKVKNNEYEVDFYQGMKKYEAKYEADGTWKRTSCKIDKKDVPEAVIKAWKLSDFNKWEIDDVVQVEGPGGKISYILELEKGNTKASLHYSNTGELLKAKTKEK